MPDEIHEAAESLRLPRNWHTLVRSAVFDFFDDRASLGTTRAAATHCPPSISVHKITRRKSLGPFTRIRQ
jgi:hypothetical protein